MKTLNLLKMIGIESAIAFAGTAQAFMPQVGVFGPQGEGITYERRGNTIIIREYKKSATISTLENPDSKDAEDQRVRPAIEIPISVFREVVKVKLAMLDKNALSDGEKTWLEQALTEIPNLEEDRKVLGNLTKDLAAVKDREDLKSLKLQLESELQCVQERLGQQTEIIEAKNKFDAIFKKLENDMEGPELKQGLGAKDAGKTIVFNLLHEIAATKKCSELSGKQKAGTTCVTSQGMMLVRVSQPEGGWHVASANGKTWFDGAKAGINHAEAKEFCNKPGLALPSKEDFEAFRTYFARNQDGRFTDEGRTELYALFPNMQGKRFWSDSPHPFLPGHAFVFNGHNGAIVFYDVRDFRYGNIAVRCVSAPSVKR